MATKSYLFKDILKTPGYLSQFDVMRLRKLANEVPEEEFQDFFSCSRDSAKRILFFWEIAQVELWNAAILENFFHLWIYQDRYLVAQRIQAAQIAGRLPERCTPVVGLEWLMSENVLLGMIPQWILANARQRPIVGSSAPDTLASTDPDEWTGERLAAEQAVLKAKGVTAPTKVLAEMSGLSDRDIRRRIESHTSKKPSAKNWTQGLGVTVHLSSGATRKKPTA